MKASLKIEAIGHDEVQKASLCYGIVSEAISQGVSKAIFGHPMHLARWGVKEVDVKGRLVKWVRGRTDYSEANSQGSRGVFIYYILESGHRYYVKSPQSWGTIDEYYCHVTSDGSIEHE